jgi:hypothetical protein
VRYKKEGRKKVSRQKEEWSEKESGALECEREEMRKEGAEGRRKRATEGQRELTSAYSSVRIARTP